MMNPEGPYTMNEPGAVPEEPGARRRFVQRVFCFAILQLVGTALCASVFIYTDLGREYLKEIDYLELSCLFWFGVLSLCVVYCRPARRGCLGIVCAYMLLSSSTCMVATIAMECSIWDALLAGILTTIMTLMFICVSACTSLDITRYRIFVLVFVRFGIAGVGILSIVKHAMPEICVVELILAIVGSLIFSLLLLYDVQTIVGGRLIAIKTDYTLYARFQLCLAITLTFVYLMMLKFL